MSVSVHHDVLSGSHSISVSCQDGSKSIIPVIKPFKRIVRGRIHELVVHLISAVIQLVGNSVKVVAYYSFELKTISEHQKLRFNSAVKVLLDQWGFVAVNFKMEPALILFDELKVILFDFRHDWVP